MPMQTKAGIAEAHVGTLAENQLVPGLQGCENAGTARVHMYIGCGSAGAWAAVLAAWP